MNAELFLTGVLFVVFQAGCCNCDNQTLKNQNSTIYERHISSETAVLIAKGALQTSFTDKDYDVSVKDGVDNWEIHFSTKCVGCTDGHPFVKVNKANGEVIRVFRYGEPMSLEPNK